MSRLEPQREVFRKLQEDERARAVKRVEFGTASFLAGDDALLLQKEVRNAFAETVYENEASRELIVRLSDCLRNDNLQIRSSAISLITLIFTHQPSLALEESPLQAICMWLEKEEEFFTELAVLLSSMKSIFDLHFKAHSYELVTPVLRILFTISTGKTFKDHRIKHESSRFLDAFVTVDLLENLWQEYRGSIPAVRVYLKEIFRYLGTKAGTFLLHHLVEASDKVERLLLIDVLGNYDSNFHTIVFDCLFAKPPWFVVRNILTLVAELEADISDRSFEIFTSYKDVRVQEELVNTLILRGGRLLDGRLLQLLPQLDPRVQIFAVNGLLKSEDKEVLTELLNFVEGHFHHLIQHEQTMIALCAVLEKLPTIRGEGVLRHLQAEAAAHPQYARLNHFVAKALAYVHPQLRHEECVHNVPDDIRSESDPQVYIEAQSEMQRIFAEIEKKAQGESAATKAKALCVLGLTKFEEGKRALARALLDMALEIDPNGAVNFEKLAEKFDSSVGYYEVLFNRLSRILSFLNPDQIDKIKQSIEIEEYRIGETVIKKGEINPALYFVLEGELYISCLDNGKNVFLKKIGENESLGHSLFFDSSLWAENVVATMPTVVGVLSFSRLEKFKFNDSTLISKLVEFCEQQHQTPSLVAGAGAERRRDVRFFPDLTAKISLVDQLDNLESYPIAAKIENISRRGAAVSVCLSGQKNVHTFLGTEVNVSFTIAEVPFVTPAYIVAVRWLSKDIYTLHVSFLRSLEKEILQAL